MSSFSLPSSFVLFFFFNDTATTEIYTLSLHDALPICHPSPRASYRENVVTRPLSREVRSEEHTSELQSLRHLVCRLLLEKKKQIEAADRLHTLGDVESNGVNVCIEHNQSDELLAGLRDSFFFNDPATTEIYTLSLHDALPIWKNEFERAHATALSSVVVSRRSCTYCSRDRKSTRLNSSHLGISYDVLCLKKNNTRVDLTLKVGAVEESVTVSGLSPVVDVSTTTASVFFFKDTPATEIYTLSLHDALPISFFSLYNMGPKKEPTIPLRNPFLYERTRRSEEHTSELQSLRHLVCRLLLEKKKKNTKPTPNKKEKKKHQPKKIT